MARSVLKRQRVAFFDNRILDADAPSHFNRNMSYMTAMRTAVREKKKKYQERCGRGPGWELHTFSVHGE